ncbi:MAG: M23 family metallopeptidase [Cyanophyceae cyanobacterium]
MGRSCFWLGTLGLALTTGLVIPAAIAQDTSSEGGGAASLQVPSAPVAPPQISPSTPVVPPPRAVPNPRPRRSPVTIPSAPVVTPPHIPSSTGSGFIDRSKNFDLGATQPIGDVQFSTRQGAGQSGTGSLGALGAILSGGSPATNLGRLASGAASLPDAPTAVRIGPLSVSAKGIGIGSNFFFRTERPKGIAGNNDRGFVFPLSVPSAISSTFGWRTHPVLGYRRFHAGTDLAAAMGTPVTAVLSGKVTWSNFLGGYGLAVALEHKDGTQKTLYGHLSEVFVKPGDSVKQGDVIGRVGSTGLSTGPHLHLEVREFRNGGWVALDPGQFLKSAGAPIPATNNDKKQDPFELMMTRLIAAMEESHRGQYNGEDLEKLKTANKDASTSLESQQTDVKLPTPGQDDRLYSGDSSKENRENQTKSHQPLRRPLINPQ